MATLAEAFLLATSGLLVAVAALLLLRGQRRGSRLFAYLLLLVAVSAFPEGFADEVGGPLAASGWAVGLAYVRLAEIPAILAFALVFPRPRALPWGLARAAPALLVGLTVALEGALLLDRGLWVDPASGRAGLLGVVEALRLPLMAALGWVWVRDFARAPPGPDRASPLLVGLAFTLWAFYSGVRVLLYDLAGVTSPPATLLDHLQLRPTTTAFYLALPFGVLVLRELLRAARRAGSEDRAAAVPARAAFAAVLLVAGTAGLTAFAAALGPQGTGPLFALTFRGVYSLTLPVLVTYTLLRHRVFDIDLRVKWSIRQGTVVGAFVGLFVLVGEGSKPWLGLEAGPYAGLAAAALLVLGLTRVQRLGERFAELALPGVARTPDYLQRRRLEVYRAALEQALAGAGAPGPREAAMLASLRQELGLSQEEHARVELAVRSAGAVALRPDPVQGELMLGRYRVLHKLGAGAHGTTFLAEDRDSGARVALKVLRPELAAEGTLREARALQRVRHPNVVALREVVEVGGQAYLLTEFVEGGSLAERLRRGPLGAEESRRLALGLLEGLGAVHAAGLVHRDVKPANVLLGPEGEPRLADFGVAHVPGAETTLGGRGSEGAVGTVRYMSPEQAKGRKVTPRSDLFSAAATLYEAWTGHPYLKTAPGESAVELQMRAAAQGPFRAPLPGARAALRAWVARALHPDPARRFPSAGAMRAALEAALEETGPAVDPLGGTSIRRGPRAGSPAKP